MIGPRPARRESRVLVDLLRATTRQCMRGAMYPEAEQAAELREGVRSTRNLEKRGKILKKGLVKKDADTHRHWTLAQSSLTAASKEDAIRCEWPMQYPAKSAAEWTSVSGAGDTVPSQRWMEESLRRKDAETAEEEVKLTIAQRE